MRRPEARGGAAALALLGLAASFFFAQGASARAPVLFSAPANESPVRGDPDNLLMIPGHGFAKGDVVVYAKISTATQAPDHPSDVPRTTTAESGVARVVSFERVPFALTVLLPADLERDQTYALWVRNEAGEWSNGIRINDARPLWFSPVFAYSTAPIATLPRELKVIGRNFQPQADAQTSVRLSGPKQWVLAAKPLDDARGVLREYVAKVDLPASMPVGEYKVEITRDGKTWVAVPEYTLEVKPDPAPRKEFPVASDSCRPNDGADDTPCIVKAIDSARASGGVVVFGPGTWDMVRAVRPGTETGDGILVPDGVALRGAGASATKLVRHGSWTSGGSNVLFTLLGRNAVSGITFTDTRRFAMNDSQRPILQIGPMLERVPTTLAASAASTEQVEIFDNVFDKVHGAIVDGGLPIRRLFVTRNVFGAFRVALNMRGNRFNMRYPSRIDDSVISGNTFYPGSHMDVAAKQGTMASELSGGSRMDFSENVADGTSTRYLNDADDPRGWRAAFFWNMNSSHEMVLVSENKGSCTGDKDGDGEFVAFDNSGNTFGFTTTQTLTAVSEDSLSIATPLNRQQNGREVTSLGSYYLGHWVQVVDGPGLGQVRKIVGYSMNPRTRSVTLQVSPAWDVPPQAGVSRIGVGRENWQVYVLANEVDHRQPKCLKTNRTRQGAGNITLWSQSADSVVAGNTQYDTDGILFQQIYSTDSDPAHCKNCPTTSAFQSFIEIRDNLIDGEYRWESACSLSGITGSLAASPTPSSPPPVVSFGVSIAHNTIRHADGLRGGAVVFPVSWFRGPPPYRWAIADNVLIQHNSIEDIPGDMPRAECGFDQKMRAGIRLDGPDLVTRTVLYGNSCEKVSRNLVDQGAATVRVCPSPVKSSCECRSSR